MERLSPTYRITLICKKQGKLTTAENVVGMSFRCPLCNQPLAYLHGANKLGAHGATDASVGHELRKVQEVRTAIL